MPEQDQPQDAPEPEGVAPQDAPEPRDAAPREAAPQEAAPQDMPAPDPAATDVEAEARDAERAAAASRSRSGRGRARRAAVVGLRVVTGVVGTAAAVAVVAAVGLLPVQNIAIAAPSVQVTPAPADQLRLCPGALLHLGDEQGQNAGTASSIGTPERRASAQGATVDATELARSDADTGGTASAPVALRVPGGSGLLGGAQSQLAATDDETGFAAAACAEPSGSIWLVGGATTTGRTTLLTLANPTQVDATVTLQILGEKGLVQAPGLSGITVAAGAQRVISLAGFAPDLASPTVHVTARGGRIVAELQQSTVRGLDAGGVDLVGATADPATRLRIPGVRVLGADVVASALARDDWSDAAPTLRIANPGDVAAKVQVALLPEAAGAKGTSFEVDVPAGQSVEKGLDSGVGVDSGALAVPDGAYTVTLASSVPVVAAARISTAVTPSVAGSAPASDFAWDPAAPALDGPTLVTIAPGPDARIAFSSPTAGTVTLKGVGDAADITIAVPADGQASATVAAGASYVIAGADGMTASVGYAGPAQLASYPVVSPRPVSGALTVHP
jgi:hypothetical protein